MNKGEQLYEGKAKIIYATQSPEEVITYYKDDATAFNALKKGSIADKGIVNAKMSATLFAVLEKKGVKTHFRKQLSDRELLVDRVKIIPIEVVVRNVAAGSLCKRLGIEKGKEFKPALVEFFYKDDALGDPLMTDEHVRIMGLASPKEVETLKKMALKINDVLVESFAKVGLRLVDFKLEFGWDHKKNIVLADEISPDTCRLWDIKTGEVLDKDRFRFDMGNVENAYQEVLKRLGGVS